MSKDYWTDAGNEVLGGDSPANNGGKAETMVGGAGLGSSFGIHKKFPVIASFFQQDNLYYFFFVVVTQTCIFSLTPTS